MERQGGTRRAGYLLLCLLIQGSFSARAVVDANSRANTNAPPNGAPWTYVGTVNGASGIYLANGWVLTAAHVGAGNLSLNGTTYTYDGTSRRLTNPDSTATDLVLFHLSSAPALAPLGLVSATPAAGSLVVMIGYGHIAGSEQTSFGQYTGFSWSAAQPKNWGDNRVASGGVTVINEGLGDVFVFTTSFTAPGPFQTANEGQATTGDSGGGVFYQTGSGWQLAGVMDSISLFPDQPAATSVYGNETYSADVATYRNQILATLAASGPTLTITPAGGNTLVRWPDTGVAYTLQRASNLTAPDWMTVTQPQTVVNGQVSVSVPATGSASFFRLQLTGP